MKREFRYISNPGIYAIYIKSLNLLVITTNAKGQHGLICYIN